MEGAGKSLEERAEERRFTRRKEEAEHAIAIAIAALEDASHPTSDQIGDLADAVDALKQREFYVCVLLAHGAMHSKPLKSGRPEAMSRTLSDIKREFHALRVRVEA
jgi:hypothetical protein